MDFNLLTNIKDNKNKFEKRKERCKNVIDRWFKNLQNTVTIVLSIIYL